MSRHYPIFYKLNSNLTPRRKQTVNKLLLLFVCGIPASCTSVPTLDEFANSHKLTRRHITAEGFRLSTLSPADFSSPSDLRVYIAGDGRPWQGNQPTVNPTGDGLLALNLMLSDSRPAIFLTRPCYNLAIMPEQCTPALWTSGRYSNTIVSVMTTALLALIDHHQATSLTLLGHSGGGVIALLAAERIPVPTTVITIASNLDIDAWTDYHGFLPLTESLNPVTQLNMRNSNKVHLIGNSDQLVPVSTLKRYIDAYPEASYQYFDSFGHNCCWLKNWAKIIAGY